MTAKLLSEKAISVISEYLNFSFGVAVCNIPYYNNKFDRLRAALRARAGKGSPKEIRDEVENLAVEHKVNLQALDSVSFKKFLVDNNVGIDCSGLTYYILNAESIARGKGKLKLSYPNAKGFMGFLRSTLRPIENTDVATLAHDKNSRPMQLRYIEPGDFITMQRTTGEKVRDHVIIVHEVNYKDDVVSGVSYTHTIAWPTDGEYNHGVRQGFIRIIDLEKPITEQEWIEDNKSGEENYTHTRALNSTTEIRRLNGL